MNIFYMKLYINNILKIYGIFSTFLMIWTELFIGRMTFKSKLKIRRQHFHLSMKNIGKKLNLMKIDFNKIFSC
jgi:hypothetical protein